MGISSNEKDTLVILGCGGHARSVFDSYERSGNDYGCVIFVDKNARPDERIYNKKVLSEYDMKEATSFFVAIGDNIERQSVLDELKKTSLDRIISIIDNSAVVSNYSVIEKGVFIGSNTRIGPSASVGFGSIVNTGAIVEHEVCIGDYCHISCNATVCGRTVIGDRVFIGAGATIIDKIRVCNDVIIGAGSVVVDNICEPGVYVGSPVRKIR